MPPLPIVVPMPIRTPRLLIRPSQAGDGVSTAAAVAETWDSLHRWMAWAERLEDNTAERQETRTHQVKESFLRREEFNLLGIELATGEPVVWCGYHNLHWDARACETGFWVRKRAQNQGLATEATNALLRYAFGPLGMRQVGIAHAGGNEASRRVIEKLGFIADRVQPAALAIPGGRMVDRHSYFRLDTDGLPDLDVSWG